MNRKLALISAGSFSLGALVGWAVTGDYHERKARRNKALFLYEKAGQIKALREADAAPQPVQLLEEVKLHSVSVDAEPNAFGETLEIIEQSPEQQAEAEKADEDSSEEDEEADEDDDFVVPEGETVEVTRSNLQALIDQYTAEPEVVDDFVQSAERVIEGTENTPPFVISRQTYAYDETGEGDDYAKITLTYYPKDRVLLDDDEDVVEDIARTIGWRNLQQFGNESDDPDVVFVRNRRMMTDFEVVRDDESQLPLHVSFGMSKDAFNLNKAAGLIKEPPSREGGR